MNSGSGAAEPVGSVDVAIAHALRFNNVLGSHSGEAATTFQPDGTRNADGTGCVKPGILGGPCVDLANEVKKDGSTPKFNLTYKFTPDHMVYATVSKGFRPGGINRRTQAPPDPPLATYDPDFLKNYELGFKTTWLNNHLRVNGAFFWEDWKNFQFGLLGQNSFTIVRNAGSARIRGAEQEIEWAVSPGFTLTAAATELDPKMNQDFCLDSNPATGVPFPLSTCPTWDAVPSGTQLPTVAKFKGNVTARYTFALGSDEIHLQGDYVYQGSTNSDLSPAANALIGRQPAYGIFDVTAGLTHGRFNAELFVDNLFDKRAELFRFAECTIFGSGGTPICGLKPLANINTPRMIGIRFGERF